MTTLQIRPETTSDAAAIAAMIRACYQDVPFSNHREHLMVERLRGSSAYISQLALVAWVGDAVAGHVMMTRMKVRGPHGDTDALALAPLSVSPAFQGQGVGSALVEAVHAHARSLGYKASILVGISGYYHRFGYRPLDDYPISLPFDVHPDHRMALALTAGGLDGVRGTVEYAPEWMDG